jgi:hypothetical protein
VSYGQKIAPTGVARFFLTHYTKAVKIVPNCNNKTNCHRIYQMAVKYYKWQYNYIIIFHSKAL